MIMPAPNSIPSVDQDLSDASPHPVGHTGPHAEVPAQDVSHDSQSVGTKRLKPGERRIQILQTLAGMLEQPTQERVTTATLAAKLALSEAALYRHFASKAQMFEGLIEFIEESPLICPNCFSRGAVTSEAMTSGSAPGYWEVT